MAFEPSNLDVSAERDASGQPRVITHIGNPFLFDAAGKRPRDAVLAYLDALDRPLGLSASMLGFLGETGDDDGANGKASLSSGVQLRWAVSFPTRDDGRVFLLQQTQVATGRSGPAGIDVEHAGLRISVESIPDGRFAIRGLVSTLNVEIRALDETQVDTVPTVDAATVNLVLAGFGFAPTSLAAAAIEAPLVLHRYNPRALETPLEPQIANAHLTPGAFYPARILRFPPLPARDPAARPWELTAWLPDWADVPAQAVPLRSIALVTHATPPATGWVFKVDPVTQTGRFDTLGTHAPPDRLDLRRSARKLTGLHTPTGGDPWRLQGDRVVVMDGDADPGGIGVDPPSEPVVPEFHYGSRTNEFAAVNAYYHTERMVSLLDGFGIPLSSFPMFTAATGRYRLPIQLVHRGSMFPGPCQDGNCINAQAEVLPTGINGEQVIQLRFALADLSRSAGTPENPNEPLGIACDARVVWHEFCHALITASTNELEFPFAHSAGDALGAIMCDPGSALASGGGINADDRFITYPWGTTPGRRHDRRAENGWGWRGPLGTDQDYWTDWRDDQGYDREQVLSSTLFRLYQAIGGDEVSMGEPNVLARRRAARYAAYLIVRAIASLGPGIVVSTFNAGAFALAMQLADSATTFGPAPESRVGGTAHKAIDWAFQVQGEPPLAALNGAMPPDMYVANTARRGEYDYTDQWEVDANGIWVTASSGGGSDAGPVAGMQNFVFVRVANRLGQAGANVKVTVHVAKGNQAGVFPKPANWKVLPPFGTALALQNQATPGTQLIFGPYVWIPASSGQYKLLAVVEADGDPSNVNPATNLPCSYTPTPLKDLVPLDNNLGLRTVVVS